MFAFCLHLRKERSSIFNRESREERDIGAMLRIKPDFSIDRQLLSSLGYSLLLSIEIEKRNYS